MDNLEFDGIIEKGKLEMIDIEKLMPSPLNSYDTSDIKDLRGNIQACGLITPLTVIGPNEKGKYHILSGEKRFKALTQLVADGADNYRKVPCYVCGDENMHELEQKLIIESANLEAREQSSSEKDVHRLQVMRVLKAMSELKDDKHSNITRVAKMYMGMSERYRRMYLRVIEQDDKEVYDLITSDKLGVSQADKIFGMEEEDRKEATERISKGEVAKNVIQDIKEKKKEEKKNKEPKEENSDNVSETAKAIMSGEDVSQDEIINRFNELTEQDKPIEYNSSTEKYNDYKPYSSDTSVSDEAKATMVMKWCKEMLQKENADEFEDYEIETIDVCRRLVEHYDNI